MDNNYSVEFVHFIVPLPLEAVNFLNTKLPKDIADIVIEYTKPLNNREVIQDYFKEIWGTDEPQSAWSACVCIIL